MKRVNHLMTLVLAGVMAFGLVFIGSGHSAKAVSKTTSFTFHATVESKSYIHTSENYKNVYTTVEMGRTGTWESAAYCKLYLQRYTNGSWKTIDTASGNASYGRKLNVTFTNIAKKSASTRVKLKLYNNWNHSDYMQTVYSSKWTR